MFVGCYGYVWWCVLMMEGWDGTSLSGEHGLSSPGVVVAGCVLWAWKLPVGSQTLGVFPDILC